MEIVVLEKSMEKLRVSIFSCLNNIYSPIYGTDEAKFWSAAILNEILLEKPGNKEAELFYNKNKDQIQIGAKKAVINDSIISAISHLYSAQILYIAIMNKDPLSDRSIELSEHATKVGIYILNTYDICGSNDARECIYKIALFADDFMKSILTK